LSTGKVDNWADERGGASCKKKLVSIATMVLSRSYFGESRETDTISTQGLIGEVKAMDNFTFGVTMMVCGMGGTILTLYIMSLIMRLLGKFFPEKKEG
jgi:hypothetical protein